MKMREFTTKNTQTVGTNKVFRVKGNLLDKTIGLKEEIEIFG